MPWHLDRSSRPDQLPLWPCRRFGAVGLQSTLQVAAQAQRPQPESDRRSSHGVDHHSQSHYYSGISSLYNVLLLPQHLSQPPDLIRSRRAALPGATAAWAARLSRFTCRLPHMLNIQEFKSLIIPKTFQFLDQDQRRIQLSCVVQITGPLRPARNDHVDPRSDSHNASE